VYRLLKSVDNYRVEMMLTLALVMGGYALASVVDVSGPIAIVVAGLFIGNRGRRLAMSKITRKSLDAFWDLINETLNALLFVLIGLEILVLTFTRELFYAGLLARRHFRRAGVVAARRPRARNRAGHDLYRGRLFHSGPGPDPQARRARFGETVI